MDSASGYKTPTELLQWQYLFRRLTSNLASLTQKWGLGILAVIQSYTLRHPHLEASSDEHMYLMLMLTQLFLSLIGDFAN